MSRATNEQVNPTAGTHTEAGRLPQRREPGVFIPRHVLLGTAIAVIAVSAATLAATAPVIGMPVGVGVAVAGLLNSVFGSRRRDG
ncbi:hypothetical protein AB0C21_38935 [Spirillospora sp. NPDC049024]